MTIQSNSSGAAAGLHFIFRDIALLASADWNNETEAGATTFLSFDFDEATTTPDQLIYKALTATLTAALQSSARQRDPGQTQSMSRLQRKKSAKLQSGFDYCLPSGSI